MDGDDPRTTSYGVYISQLIRFARASGQVIDFNNPNKMFKLLNSFRKGTVIINYVNRFSKFYRRHSELVSKYNVGLKTPLLEVLFDGDLVYKFKKIVGKTYFLVQFNKTVTRYKKISYSVDILRQIACMVVNPIKVDNFASLFNCTTVDRSSD